MQYRPSATRRPIFLFLVQQSLPLLPVAAPRVLGERGRERGGEGGKGRGACRQTSGTFCTPCRKNGRSPLSRCPRTHHTSVANGHIS